jgi:tetratricopeptide (TPR) repeat protein
MKRILTLALVLAVAIIAPAMAERPIAELKADYEAAIKLATAAPQDYALNWKAAKAARDYADQLVTDEASGWKDTARPIAKDGMKFGEIAFKLNPTGVEGWYWYACSVGSYSDCVSILKALGEGLKGKTQMGFENAYKFDKKYDKGGPILGLGRFWQVLPGIAGQDRKKAEALFNEYLSIFGSDPDMGGTIWFYRGELYKDTGRIAEAKADLKKGADKGNKNAARLLAELK